MAEVAPGGGAARQRPTFALSKFAVPDVGRAWVPRTEQLRRLDGTDQAALVLVTGSPGSGKTTLLAHWARAQPAGTVAWLTCDRADADQRRLWWAVIDALRTVRPGFGTECQDLLELSRDIDYDVLEALLTACQELPEPVTIVLDDFQLLTSSTQDQLAFLLGRGLGRVRLALGSRTEPTMAVDRLRLSGTLVELREVDLRFSAAEADQLLRAVGVTLSAADLAVVMKRTEGWVAGLQLAAVALRGSSEPDALLSRIHGSHQVIGHYLWTEVFEVQTAGVRRFLLDTCIVDELSPGLAAALSPGTPVTLLDIEAANLLLVRLAPSGEVFRYHQLFAEMLRHRLHSSDPEHELVLHERAAGWFLEHRDPVSAFRHQWRSGQRTAAIAGVHGAVLDSYYDDLLPAFVDSDRLLTDSDLLAAPAAAVSYSAALLARGFLDDADRLGGRVDVVAGGLLDAADRERLTSVRVITTFALGDTRTAVRLAQEILDSARTERPQTDWGALGVIVMARALAWQGDHESAAQVLRTARPDPQSRAAQLELVATVAFCRLMTGALDDALSRADRLSDQLSASGIGSPDLLLHPIAMRAAVLLERGDLDAAEPLLLHVATAPSRLRIPARVLAKAELARVWRARDDIEGALAALDDALRLLSRRALGSGLVDHVQARRAWLLIGSARLHEAAGVIKTLSGEFARSALTAHRALASRDPGAAAEALLAAASVAVTRRQRLEVSLLELRLRLASGEPCSAAAAAVFGLAESQGFVQLIAEAGSEALDAVRQIAHGRPRSPFVDALMSARPVAPPRAAAQFRDRYESLSERERTVLGYLDTSMTSREIADRLFVSVNTVKTHTRNIIRKLGATSRADAVGQARRLHYL